MCAAFQISNLYKLPESKLTNANILCLVRFGSGWNKLVQLLIRSRNSGDRTIPSLVISHTRHSVGVAVGSAATRESYRKTKRRFCIQ